MSASRSGSIFLVFITLVFAATNTVAEEADPIGEIDPDNAVTFSAIVAADSFETVLTATIGETQTTPAQLADAIRNGSGHVLRITAINGHVFSGPVPPAATDYASAFVGACTPRLSVRGFGNGPIAFGGRGTVQVNYRPGLVASLTANEVLCLRSLVQSNQRVLIEVHGYLQKHPSAKN